MRSLLLCFVFGLVATTSFVRSDDKVGMPVTAAQALKRLEEGNARFVEGKRNKDDLAARRAETAKGQHPFAIVLTCADSRLSPELIFDQGLGDVFVLRVAGNVTDPAVLGSIEYAVEHLHAGLIVVLGHEKCGAVDAVVSGAKVEGNLAALAKLVQPGTGLPTEKGAAVSTGVRNNARYHANEMAKSSKVLKEFIGSGRVQVVPAVYALDSGKVEWLKDAPKVPAKP